MPIAGIFRTDLRQAAALALISAGTLAGTRVYSPRTWPQRPDELPALIVTTPSERKHGLGRSLPRFTSTISLTIAVRVRGRGPDAVTMNADAEAQLEMLCSQVETTLMCSPAFMKLVQQVAEVETHMIVSAESEVIIGEAAIKLDCEVYQEFFPASGDLFLAIDAQFETSAGQPLAAATFTLPQS